MSMPSTRWMALWLPRLPTDRLTRANAALSKRPLALYAKSSNAFALTAVNAVAAQAGLSAGMALADARAILPSALMLEADEAADAAMLDQIGAWCERFSPTIVLDPGDGLFLDVSGCAHLFGGEAALLDEVARRLKAQGFAVRCAIAPTPGAAWALARFRAPHIADADHVEEALSALPVAALRLTPDAAALLKRLGLKHIGQIAQAPRAPFAARAGQKAMLRLDQAFGRAREALTPRRPSPPVFALHRLLEPVLTQDAILCVVEQLTADLCAEIDQRGLGVQRAALHLFGVDGKTRHVELGLSKPARAPALLLRLLRERLAQTGESFDAEFGFEALRLDACELAPIALQTVDLAPTTGRDPAAETRLIDMLAVRLGMERVGRLAPRDAHAPERASALIAPQSATPATPAPPKDGAPRRPLTLFAHAQPIEALAETPDGPPIRFRWRRVLHDVARAEGPERIAPNWLRAPLARPRDYFRVEDREGRRFWLYREGLYGDEAPPRWFVHGLFA
ncbi:MAG: DNA polymerase Y family protein [Hyphomonadaceae bacterium]